MSELQHPPINFEPSRTISAEREFAERAYEVMSAYGNVTIAQVFDDEAEYATTPTVDLLSRDGVEETKFRLMGTPVLAIKHSHELPNTDNYLVVQLQYGTFADRELADEEQWYTPQHIDWTPYIMVVINTHELDDVSVLDARNGQTLDEVGLMQAEIVLGLVQQELQGMEFEDLEEVETTSGYQDDYDIESGIAPYYCHACMQANIPCAHNPFTLN